MQKSIVSFNRILKLVRRLEDRLRSGRQFLSANSVHVAQTVMEDLTAGTSTGNSGAREAGRKTWIPGLSIRCMLHGMLDLYHYKIQVFSQAYTDARQNFAIWELAQKKPYR